MLAFIHIIMSMATAASLSIHGAQQLHRRGDSPFGLSVPFVPRELQSHTDALWLLHLHLPTYLIVSRNGKIKEPPSKGNGRGKYM